MSTSTSTTTICTRSGRSIWRTARFNVDWTEDFKTPDPVTTPACGQGHDDRRRAGRAQYRAAAHFPRHRAGQRRHDRPSRQPDACRCHGGPDAGHRCRCPSSIWRRRRARPPRGAFGINFAAGNVVQEETIRITGPVLNLSGTADFNRNGELTVLNLPSVRMGPLNDLSFQLARGPNGDDYLLRGRSLDGSKIGRTGSNERRAAVQPQPADDTSAGRIPYQRQAGPAGDARRCFHRAVQSGARRHRQPAVRRSVSAAMSPRARDSAPLAAKLENTGTARKVTVTSGDAGLLARGLFAFESMRGGELAATINLPGQASDPPNPNAPADFTGDDDGEEFPDGQPASDRPPVCRGLADRSWRSDGRRWHQPG